MPIGGDGKVLERRVKEVVSLPRCSGATAPQFAKGFGGVYFVGHNES